jgi:hypothetical protein
MDLPGVQRFVSVIAGLLLALAVVLGFWPVSVTVVGNNPYSCGSGFVHSRNTWKVDSAGLVGPTAIGALALTPNSKCPNPVYGRRDLAITLAAFALLGGIAAVALGPPLDPSRRRRNRRTRSSVPAPAKGSGDHPLRGGSAADAESVNRDVAPVIAAQALLAHGMDDDAILAYITRTWRLSDADARSALAAAGVLVSRGHGPQTTSMS